MTTTTTTHAPAHAAPRHRVLVVDDDLRLRDLLKRYLTEQGFAADTVPDGVALDRAFTRNRYDLVVLDVMLPNEDGFAICQRLRASSAVEANIPIIMLTAKGDDEDRIGGLEIGADDYLPKTFSTRELLARLRAVTRRASTNASRNTDKAEPEMVVGPLRINEGTRTAVLGDRPLTLTPVEFDLLASLARTRGRVKTREALLDEIRDRNYEVFDRSIDVHISGLRKKLGDDPKTPRFIRTLRTAGYMLINPDME